MSRPSLGQARKGYRPIDGIEDCVTNALREAEKFSGLQNDSFSPPRHGSREERDSARAPNGSLALPFHSWSEIQRRR